jgi:hypothetical protein
MITVSRVKDGEIMKDVRVIALYTIQGNLRTFTL